MRSPTKQAKMRDDRAARERAARSSIAGHTGLPEA
jgi:hypothetical protein